MASSRNYRRVSDPSEVSDPQRPVISDELSQRLKKYKGKWVAVYGDVVVAAGHSASEVTKAAAKRRITDPLVFRVPKHPERINYL
jgi:hypothetical protein